MTTQDAYQESAENLSSTLKPPTLRDEITSGTTSDDTEHTHSDDRTKSELNHLFYPVGSIYTSMNSTSLADLFRGTWEQITDRFLYCANSSGTTGSSSTLSEANLPAHTHTFTGVTATDSLQSKPIEDSLILFKEYANNEIFSYSQGSSNSSKRIAHLNAAPSSVKSDLLTWTYTPEGTISRTGSGEEFMPPYMTVYAWYCTA